MFVPMFAVRLDKASPLSDGKYAIILRVTCNRRNRKRRTGLTAGFEQWDFNSHEFKKGVHERREKNEKLEKIEEKANRIYEKHFEGRAFSFDEFFKLFEEKPVEKVTVLEFCEEVSQQFAAKGQATSSNDYKYLTNVIAKVAPKNMTFSDFTVDWLREFEEHYTSQGLKCYNHMLRLRALYNKAVQRRIADFKYNPYKNPYTNPYGYDFSHLKKRRIAKTNDLRMRELNKEQLLQLMSYEPKSANGKKYLAMWFFSYYMFGVNLTDLAHLQRKDIRDGRWFYSRSKTGVGLKRGKPILPEAQKIIDEYDTGGKYIFDIITPHYDKDVITVANRLRDYANLIRKASRKASEALEFSGYFTYYSARYSSATLALNEGADRNTVSHLLDHENFSTIDNYAGRADDSKVLAAMEVLRLKS
jgi:integrase/recombinase XerD